MEVKNLWLQVDTAHPLALKERSHVLKSIQLHQFSNLNVENFIQ